MARINVPQQPGKAPTIEATPGADGGAGGVAQASSPALAPDAGETPALLDAGAAGADLPRASGRWLVRAKATPFRRCGRLWTHAGSEIDGAEFTADDLARLIDEPMLIVVNLSV